MTKQEIIDTLTAEGGKLWEKGGKHRVYFDTGLMLGRVGLDVESYKTGNIARSSTIASATNTLIPILPFIYLSFLRVLTSRISSFITYITPSTGFG